MSFSKPLDAHPEPKKPSAAAASRKGGGSSASGLKKFFCTLSQSTKQKLGRFRCYSMDQIPPEAPNLAPSPEATADATDCSNLKKAPSLQSLRLVSLKRDSVHAAGLAVVRSFTMEVEHKVCAWLTLDRALGNIA